MSPLEIAANAVITASILLAARNSIHTWWSGVIGCGLFACLFYQHQLYADVLLQVFFVGTSVFGWWQWLHGQRGATLPIGRTPMRGLILRGLVGLALALAYGMLLKTFTDAYAPFLDSAVLTFSVIAQVLLMQRRIETWWFWLAVNTIAIPLYASRGLELTAILYAAYWVNAAFALRYWTKLCDAQRA